jgi:hypothetical protein
MKSNIRWLVTLLIAWSCAEVLGRPPSNGTILDADIVWDPTCVEGAAVSPDGKQFTYVSKGAIWVCDVLTGPPKKLADVSNSISGYLTLPEHQDWRKKFEGAIPQAIYTPFPNLGRDAIEVYSLRWTPSQDGVVYVLKKRLQDNSTLASFRVMHAALSGEVKEIANIERELITTPDTFTTFRVSGDQKWVVVSNFGHPLIWNATTNEARVTPFDFLMPSSSSDHWLGVEIDSRQLVVTDGDFRIIKRIDITLDEQRRCDLFWSSDERFAICRSFRSNMEQISDNCREFRVTLDTGARRDLNNGVQRDQFIFTGNGGEVVRLGITGIQPLGYGDGTYGAYIELIPDGEGPSRDICGFGNPSSSDDDWHSHSYQPAVSNSDCTLFAMALPRKQGQRPGFDFHLIDRDGTAWSLGEGESGQFVSPYIPMAFADNDQTIVARSGSQLFSIPVAAIKASQSGEP